MMEFYFTATLCFVLKVRFYSKISTKSEQVRKVIQQLFRMVINLMFVLINPDFGFISPHNQRSTAETNHGREFKKKLW